MLGDFPGYLNLELGLPLYGFTWDFISSSIKCGHNNTFLKGLMWRLSELIWVLRLEQCLILEEISTCMHAQLLSRVELFATPWTIAYQAPLSTGLSWQEYWSGLPFPSGLDLPDPEVKLEVPTLAGGFFSTVPPGKPKIRTSYLPPPPFFLKRCGYICSFCSLQM